MKWRLRSYRSTPLMYQGIEEKIFPTLELAEEAAAELRKNSNYYCVEVRCMEDRSDAT